MQESSRLGMGHVPHHPDGVRMGTGQIGYDPHHYGRHGEEIEKRGHAP